jgi:hypothetical protein
MNPFQTTRDCAKFYKLGKDSDAALTLTPMQESRKNIRQVCMGEHGMHADANVIATLNMVSSMSWNNLLW